MNNQEFLTIEEASSFIKVHVKTLYKWCSSKKIPYRKHGGKLVFLKSELMEWSDSKLVPVSIYWKK